MNKNIFFILIMLLIIVYININYKENFDANKYKTIFINHEKYQIIIINDLNTTKSKIYKIYKN